MADSKIQIEVELLDKMSKQLDQLVGNTEKANKSMESSFTKVQGAMLNLGQVAQGVHNIFETYQNKTRLLENAMDRLQNTTLTLTQAKRDLATATEEVNNVSEKHKRDTNNLEQAQLNLEDAQKRVAETTARAGFEWAKGSEQERAAKQAAIDLKNAQFDLQDAQIAVTNQAKDLAQAQMKASDAGDRVTIATNLMERATRALKKAHGDSEWMWVDMAVQAMAVAGNLAILTTSIWGTTAATTALAIAASPITLTILAIAAAVAGAIYVWKNWETMSDNMRVALFLLMPPIVLIIAAIKRMGDTFQPVLDIMQKVWDMLTKIIDKAKSIGGAVTSAISNSLTGKSSNIGGHAAGGLVSSTGSYMLQKGEYVVPSNGGQGGAVSITITGNIYGTNPQEISDAILNRVRKNITLW